MYVVSVPFRCIPIAVPVTTHHHSRNRSRSRSRSPYYPRQHRDDRRSSRCTGQSPRDNGNRRPPLRTNTTHNSVGSEATKVAAAAGGESQAAVDAHEN